MDTGQRSEPIVPIETVLLRIVLAFRILGWLWLVLLVAGALVGDAEVDRTIVIGMAAVSGTWTAYTFWVARKGLIKRPWFVVADGLVALAVASTSYWAGAQSNLHGGYPISWIAVVAYASNVRWALGAGVVLFVNQWVGMDIEGSRTLSDKLGAVVFLVYGAIVGYGFDLIRQRDAMRQAAEGELEIVRDREIRNAEQQRLADHLHDSVLQTLHAIRVDSGDRDQVDLVARRQERELRRTIRSFRSEFDEPFSAAMFAARDDVEELYRVEIDMVCAYDAELTAELTGIIEATKEAMINAAKHSGSDTIIVHCSAEGDDLNVLVRDRGQGFDSASAQQLNRGIENSIVRRVEKYGGSVTVQSSESFGTEVEMLIPLGSAP